MPDEVVIQDFAKDYFPFEFPGFGRRAGHCFLRVNAYGSNIFVLCAQLLNYHSTSVTNGLESIIDRLADTLMDETFSDGRPVLKVVERFPLIRSLTHSSAELRRLRHMTVRRALLGRRTKWFELYPQGAGPGERGSLSLVTFSDGGSPSWSYASLDSFASEFPRESFEVNVDLGAWNKQAS